MTLVTFVEVQLSFSLICSTSFKTEVQHFLCFRLLCVSDGSNLIKFPRKDSYCSHARVSKTWSAAFDHLKGMQRKVMDTKLSSFSSSCKVRASAWPNSFVADIQECLHSSSSSQALGHPPFYFPWYCCKPNSQAQRSTGENCICQYIIMRASWQCTQQRSASECQHVCVSS